MGVAIPGGKRNGFLAPHFGRWFLTVYATMTTQEDKGSALSLAEFLDIFRAHALALSPSRQDVVKHTDGFSEVNLEHFGELAWDTELVVMDFE